MPTIVTKIVQDMFHSQRNKRQFAKTLRDMPAGDTSASETEDSDAESLDKSVDTSREVAKLTANRPKDEFFMWGAELSRYVVVRVVHSRLFTFVLSTLNNPLSI